MGQWKVVAYGRLEELCWLGGPEFTRWFAEDVGVHTLLLIYIQHVCLGFEASSPPLIPCFHLYKSFSAQAINYLLFSRACQTFVAFLFSC